MHDLLHDFATRLAVQRFGSMPALHEQVLDAYRAKCSAGAAGGWASGPNDGYFLQHLRHHLLDAGRGDELVQLLLDLRWLEAKAEAGLVFDLAEDFSETLRRVGPAHPRRRLLALVEEAIRADIHFVARHAGDYPQALFQCLWNACWWYDCPEAARHYEAPQGGWAQPPPWEERGPQKLHEVLEGWRRKKEAATPGLVWLRAHRPPPLHLGTAQRRVLRGHEDSVRSVALSADATTIVSGSYDQTVRVWDAASGECREVIQGTGDVEAIAAGPSRFPLRALGRVLEMAIEDAATAAPVAWFPVPIDHIATFPNGRAWVGTSANHLYIITLEGGEDSSKPKGESGKPDGEESPRSKVQSRIHRPVGGALHIANPRCRIARTISHGPSAIRRSRG
ncbi:MAG: hypothetical protein ABSA52_13400 [Candidatus Binatia bacterium]